MTSSILDRLDLRPVINACGIYTDLGGSRLSPAVWAGMTAANAHFIDMVELLEQSGVAIAELIGVEAARATPGASAAIALGIGACLAGCDPSRIEALPDTTRMPHEVILQRGHRYKYDRCVELAGARLRIVGSPERSTGEEIAAAIGPGTAALFVPAHLDGMHGTVPLAEVAAIGRAHGLPTFVDAAYMNYPVELMGSFNAQGADLACFSAKYFGGPNAAGFLSGRADLIAAVAAIDFTRHESGAYRRFGRAFKLDRQTIVATVLALEEWLTMDHEARWRSYAEKAAWLRERLAGLPHVELQPIGFTMDERLVSEPVNALLVTFGADAPVNAGEVARRLAAGDPRIRCIVEGPSLAIVLETVDDVEVEIVSARLRAAVAA